MEARFIRRIFVRLVVLLTLLTACTSAGDTASEISLPAGFRASYFVSGLSAPTGLTFDSDGTLYVLEQGGKIIAVDERGVARTAAQAENGALGLAFRPGTRDLFVSSAGRVSVFSRSSSGAFASPQVIVDALPRGRHQNDQLVFTRDGNFFFLGVGSTCDACVEPDSRSATVMKISADGKSQQVYATGLRNPYGVALNPATGELFVSDNGRDEPLTGVPDELNVVVENGRYGWPDCWGRQRGTNCGGTIAPAVELQEHSSANGFVFYDGANFPAEYRGNVFIAQWGALIPLPGIGKNIMRVPLAKENGEWRGAGKEFAGGFSRPIDVAVGPRDGALYVADHGNGKIYRIRWEGK